MTAKKKEAQKKTVRGKSDAQPGATKQPIREMVEMGFRHRFPDVGKGAVAPGDKTDFELTRRKMRSIEAHALEVLYRRPHVGGKIDDDEVVLQKLADAMKITPEEVRDSLAFYAENHPK